ncbi:hypothetical protein IAT38_008365 [Cryptococcus sp. DSM 104549]
MSSAYIDQTDVGDDVRATHDNTLLEISHRTGEPLPKVKGKTVLWTTSTDPTGPKIYTHRYQRPYPDEYAALSNTEQGLVTSKLDELTRILQGGASRRTFLLHGGGHILGGGGAAEHNESRWWHVYALTNALPTRDRTSITPPDAVLLRVDPPDDGLGDGLITEGEREGEPSAEDTVLDWTATSSSIESTPIRDSDLASYNEWVRPAAQGR